MTTIITPSPVFDVLCEASANQKSVRKGLEHVIGLGKLGLLAKELTDLAEEVSKSGYVPPARREEHDNLMKSADRTNDREAARYYREKARAIRAQIEGTTL